MDKNQIDELIDKKLAEAKLEVAEKRLNFLMWMAGAALAIFGVAFPLWQSNRSADKVDSALLQMRQENAKTSEGIRADSRTSAESLERAIPAIRADLRAEMDGHSRQLGSAANRVDNAIQDMNKQFKELAGTQFNKPALECFLKGLSLEGGLIQLTQNKKHASIQVRNTGKASARNIKVRLYSNFSSDCIVRGGNTHWISNSESDEPNYKCYSEATLPTINENGDTSDIDIVLSDEAMNNGEYPSVIKLFYEQQSEPRKYSFSIKVASQ